jgi:HPt (histidine-containing phosphotransfer) domain-containing protein
MLTVCRNGYTLAARVRAAESADQHLPIVALTASAMPDEAERCSRAGMDALLVKPARMHELREMLYRWMPATEAGPRHEPAPVQLPSPMEALTALFGPSARLDELIDSFLANARDDLAGFDQAMRAQQAQAVAGALHRINGAIKIFGGTALAETGEHIRAAVLEREGLRGQQAALLKYRQDLLELIDALDRARLAPGHA